MAIIAAFKHGAATLRRDPMLLVAGLVLGAGSHLRYVDDLVGSPVLSAGAVLAWFVTVPFVLGGFLGTARDAVGGTGASAAGFVAAARAHYLRLVLATVLFVGIVFGTAVLLGLVGLVVGVGVAALGAIHELLGVAAGVGSVLAWVASLLVVVLFVQFYDAAIVVEDHGVTGAFRRSVRLVGSNLASVVGFSLLWLVGSNAVLVPAYARRLASTLPGSANGLPTVVPMAVVTALSAAGFAYFYTVYTAYYLRLIDATPRTGREAG
jgi:hypothetical protein